MATVKTVKIELGRDYALCDVIMNNGASARVVVTNDGQGGQTYVSESDAGEALENLAERVAKNALDGIVDAIVGGD